jgi:beta-xylosidase
MVPATSDEFDSVQLGLQWQWQANPRTDFFSLTAAPGSLRLPCIADPKAENLYDAPQLLLQKFPAPTFTATTVLNFSSARENDEAGLIVFGYSYAWLGVRGGPQHPRLVLALNVDASKNGAERETVSIDLKPGKIFLRVTVATDAKCRFAYSLDGTAFVPLGDEFQSSVARWVGAKVGVFAAARQPVEKPAHADFDWFRVTP